MHHLLGMEICDDCKEGKMLLPSFIKARTVCVRCWNRLVTPSQETVEGDRLFLLEFSNPEVLNNLSELATDALEFLAKDQCYYPWAVIRQHILNGYTIYQRVGALS